MTVWAPPEDAINTLVLVDSPKSVAGFTHAPVGQKLTLCHEFHCVLCGGGGQGEAPQSPLLDDILRLLRNGGRIHQMGWGVIGSHVVDVGGR